MQPRTTPLAALLAAIFLAALVAGCGSDGSGSGYGPRETSEGEPTATATTPTPPPGAAAKSCGRTTVAGTEGLRVTGVGCDVGRGVVAAWSNKPACLPGNEASRVSCDLNAGFSCLAADVQRGVAVSCSRPGGSLAFIAADG